GSVAHSEGFSRIIGLNSDGSITKSNTDEPSKLAATSKKRSELFKYQRASCSAMNLFGKDYIDKHGASTKETVNLAYESLSKEQREVYEARRIALLEARKTTSEKTTRKGKGRKVAGGTSVGGGAAGVE
ncbi:hypothetical protein H0H93_012081, partial [Arthromyces matolae]